MIPVGSKAQLKPVIGDLLDIYAQQGQDAFIGALDEKVLQQKIRFPVLEFAGLELYKAIPPGEQLPVLDRIVALHTVGGNVLAGIILQKRLDAHFNTSVQKAGEYMILGNEWYVCDIIGERVLGHALLTQPEKTIPMLKKLARHENKWLVRSVGVASHYAIKKGLPKVFVEEVFSILLGLSNATEFHTKKGIGWAAKTTAKFYPGIIESHRQHIDTSPEVKQWFKTKVKIGLGRTSKYANRYPG